MKNRKSLNRILDALFNASIIGVVYGTVIATSHVSAMNGMAVIVHIVGLFTIYTYLIKFVEWNFNQNSEIPFDYNSKQFKEHWEKLQNN